jgi:hypothetical protein
MVTHSSTSRLVQCLWMAERTRYWHLDLSSHWQAMVLINPMLLIPPRDVTRTSERLVSQDHHIEGDVASSVQRGC